MADTAPGGPFTVVAILISGLIGGLAAAGQRGAERRAQARAEREARAAERMSLQRQQQWLDAVRRQMARGEAGDATQEDARAALRGRGGRSSELDDRWF